MILFFSCLVGSHGVSRFRYVSMFFVGSLVVFSVTFSFCGLIVVCCSMIVVCFSVVFSSEFFIFLIIAYPGIPIVRTPLGMIIGNSAVQILGFTINKVM